MRVSTRIIVGISVLMILALLALIYQVYVNRQLRLVTEDLSVINVTATDAVAKMEFLSYLIWQDSPKYLSSDRQVYGKILDADLSDFKMYLSRLQGLDISAKERTDLGQVVALFDGFQRQWPIEVAQHPQKTNYFPLDLDTTLRLLQEQVQKLERTVKDAVDDRVQAAKAMGARAQRISWISGGIALLIGGLVSILLLYTINKSLRQLTQGTRAIAEGDFSHRIPAEGRDEFAELARDFNLMSHRLGELDQMKKDFVSHVSHELKAPLASIRQTAHVLLQQIPGALNEQQRRLLRLSYNSAERLAAMVGNLLDVSRLEAGSMEYMVGPVDFLSLVRTVSEEFEVQSDEKHMTIRIETPSDQNFIVACDRDRMIQVIGNLFDNAIKFAPRDSEIVARIEEKVEGPDRLIVFSVADSGPGVPDDHKEKIFQKFHQVKYGKKVAGQGVGLGLAICRSIVEAHQGKIWVKDNPSGGSIFYLELQAAARMEVATSCG